MMPLDAHKRWDDYQDLIMQASNAIHDAVNALPHWAQGAVLGANLATILKPLSKKQRAIEAMTFIRTFLNNIDDDEEDDTCQDS